MSIIYKTTCIFAKQTHLTTRFYQMVILAGSIISINGVKLPVNFLLIPENFRLIRGMWCRYWKSLLDVGNIVLLYILKKWKLMKWIPCYWQLNTLFWINVANYFYYQYTWGQSWLLGFYWWLALWACYNNFCAKERAACLFWLR